MIIHIRNNDGTSYCGNEQQMDASPRANQCQRCFQKFIRHGRGDETKCLHEQTSLYYFNGCNGPQGMVCNACGADIDPLKDALAARTAELESQS